MRRLQTIAFLVTLLASIRTADAGGPLAFADDGTVLLWETFGGVAEITVTLDQGPFSSYQGTTVTTNAEGNALVASVLGVWNGVQTATVDLSIDDFDLGQNIDHTNYHSFLNDPYDPPNKNAVIYDEDGLIIDDHYGLGTRNEVLGIAIPLTLGNFIDKTNVLLNGRILDGQPDTFDNPEVTSAEFEGVIVHEFGHLLGLAHAQINAYDQNGDVLRNNMTQPTMFPFFYGDGWMRDLAPDDINWISHFYPAPGFSITFGSIAGEVIQRNGADQPFQGANVIARRIGGGDIDAGSCVSGYVYAPGVGPANLEGRYLIPGLRPGDYTVEIEEVDDSFEGGSIVGPVDPPVDFPGIAGPEFFDDKESPYDDPTQSAAVFVIAGTETPNINIILNTQISPARSTIPWTLFE